MMVLACCDTCGHCAKTIHKHQWALALTPFHTTHHTCMGASQYSAPYHSMSPFSLQTAMQQWEFCSGFSPCFLHSMLTNG